MGKTHWYFPVTNSRFTLKNELPWLVSCLWRQSAASRYTFVHHVAQSPVSSQDSYRKPAQTPTCCASLVPQRKWAQSLIEFETKWRPSGGDTLPRWNRKTSWHITRNATSEYEQSQLEDCFFSFLLSLTDKSKQSVSKTCRQKGQTVFITVTSYVFPLIQFNLFFNIRHGTVKIKAEIGKKQQKRQKKIESQYGHVVVQGDMGWGQLG